MLQADNAHSGFSRAAAARLEEAVDRFEDAWQRGGRPAIDDHLEGDDGERAALLIELVHVDLECRLKAGDPARVEEYLVRYPELGRDRRIVLELLAAEWKLRRRADPAVAVEEYFRRFPDYRDELAASATVSHVLSHTPQNPSPTSGSTQPLGDGTPAPAAAGPVGDVAVRSRYRILRLHARGGLGEILAARDEDLRREVALKRLQPRLAHAPESRGRFLREAEITSQLEHPGVVPVYGLGQAADGSPVYAMRLIRGETFQEAVDRFHKAERPGRDAAERRLAFRQLLGRLVSVCNTVAYAHSRGVLHRDLKPGNILLGSYGETMVLDWGLAKTVGAAEPDIPPDPAASGGQDLTQAGEVIGTPAYMSPEQADGRWEAVGPASDAYSLGATLYVLLTGRPPFGPGLVGEVLENVRRSAFPRPRQLKKEVCPSLEAVCLKAMDLRPEKRYAAALALAADLEQWLAGEPVKARREPLSARVRRWMGRHAPLVTTGAVALGAAAIVAVVTALWFAAADRENSAKELAEARQKDLNRADLERYYFHIAAADRDWWFNRFDSAAAHLAACKPEMHGWEWSYLERRARDSEGLLTLKGHDKEVWNVAFSPHGDRIASASLDGTVRVWDAAGGGLLFKLEGHKDPVWGVAFSPDGALIATGGDDRTVRLWDARTGRLLRTIDGLVGGVFGVAFNRDGSLLAAATAGPRVRRLQPNGTGGEVDLWDVPTWAARKPLPVSDGVPNSVAFSPDGASLIAGTNEGRVRRWDVATGEEQDYLAGHSGPVEATAFSPDGRWIAAAGDDGCIGLWDAHTPGPMRTLVHSRRFMAWGVAFSSDGRRMASSADDATIKIWDVALGKLLSTLHGHAAGIANVVFSPDGERLASASDDQTVKVWDAHGPRAALTLCGHKHSVWGVAISPNGRRIASAGDDGADDEAVRVWDTLGNQSAALHVPGGVRCVAFGPGGRFLAAAGGDGALHVWDADDAWTEHVLRGHDDGVLSVAFSRDGRFLASASADHTVKLWDAATWVEVRTFRGHTDEVLTVAFSPDGKLLATGGADKVVKVWDAATGEEKWRLAGRPAVIHCVAFSPDGKRLAAAAAASEKVVTLDSGEIDVWDLDTGQLALTMRGHGGDVRALAYSPDGRRLVSAGSDRNLKVWEATKGQEVLTLYDAHLNCINAVAFGPDGGRLASASCDGTVILWDGGQPAADSR